MITVQLRGRSFMLIRSEKAAFWNDGLTTYIIAIRAAAGPVSRLVMCLNPAA